MGVQNFVHLVKFGPLTKNDLEQILPNYFRRTWKKSWLITPFPLVGCLIRSRDIRDQSLELSEI